MEQLENKTCPRCGQSFECKASSISECHCSDVVLTASQRETLAEQYDSCLCHACLLTHQAEAG